MTQIPHNIEKTLYIPGMMCEHCKARVTEGFESLPEVSSVEVDLATKDVHLSLTSDIPQTRLEEFVQSLGYRIEQR